MSVAEVTAGPREASDPKIIVALDFAEPAPALALSRKLSPRLCRLKVGKELFTAGGPALVDKLVETGFAVFLDLKFHDIPNTVAQACKVAAALRVWMVDIHASGGRAMMLAAREALNDRSERPLLVGVTVLTSLDAQGLREIGIDATPQEAALRLARLAEACGLDGVVCSPLESQRLRRECGHEFLLVTPGIRPAAQSSDDQKRVATPAAALADGSNYLVIGRPITRADDPLAALHAISTEIGALRVA
jgi:orotidine-5'-phosphate decarboxylase